MASSTERDRTWQRSSIGITPLTVRRRAGLRRVTKIDVAGATLPAAAAGINQVSSHTPLITAPARRAGEGAGISGDVVLSSSSSTRPLAAGKAGGTVGVSRVCSVCARASADYSCPRCLVGYCSSKCYKAHGSSCTEAFFRGHVERETRLREEEQVGRGTGGGEQAGMKPKEDRRASMVEVLRRIRHGDRGQPGDGGDGGEANGLQQHQAVGLREENRDHEAETGSDDGGGSSGGELYIQQERLEALALALTQRGHALPTRSAPADAGPAGAGVGADVGETARIPEGNTPRSDALVSDDHSREGVSVRGMGQEENAHAGGRARARAQDRDRDRDRERPVERGLEELGGDEGMLDLLTPQERARFLREVASGRLGKLIVPWVPWWKQKARVQEVTTMTAGGRTSHSLPPPVVDVDPGHLTMCSFGVYEDHEASSSPPTCPSTPEQRQPSSGSNGSTSRRRSSTSSSTSRNIGESTCTRHTFAALLCQPFHGAPDFSTICAKRPSPTLPALAADLVYAYALAARLYNGCWCSDPVGASLALVGASPVLKDGATPGTVGQALAACVERTVEGEGASYRSYAESLREDVLLICSDPRKLVCAFQDAWGMLEAAGRTLAPRTRPLRPAANGGGGGGRSSTRGKGKKAQRRAAKELGKVEKRIGYFLLWARSHGAEVAPQMYKAVDVLPELAQRRAVTIAA
eukprot:g10285.t1